MPQDSLDNQSNNQKPEPPATKPLSSEEIDKLIIASGGDPTILRQEYTQPQHSFKPLIIIAIFLVVLCIGASIALSSLSVTAK